MKIDFTEKKCQYKSNKKLFGLCDDQTPTNDGATRRNDHSV